jgi:hypothetical protein
MHIDAESDLPADEQRMADRLAGARPAPSAGFRGKLGRTLTAEDPGYGPRPDRLRGRVIAYVVFGLLLIVLGGLSGGGVL